MTKDFPPFAEDHRECEFEKERVEHYLGTQLDVALGELTQSKARIEALEGVREDFPEWIRRNCPLCDNGVARIEEQEVWGLGEEGDPRVEGIESVAIECQYCGELIDALKKLEEV